MYEVDVLNKLQDCPFVPKIITSREVYRCPESDAVIGEIIMTKIPGQTVLEKYYPECERECYEGPGSEYSDSITFQDEFDDMFPSKYVPYDVKLAILHTLEELYCAYNIAHNDVHAGNFIESEDGSICVVDFEMW